MTKNYKLNYNQYKHLIDACLTGDFLNESLDKPMGLVTYRKLLTEDNILYFTQNTKRTCRIPLGLQKKDSKLKFIDLLERKFDYRHSDKELLLNLAKSIICYLLQSYRPDEYEVYHDLDIVELEELDNFHKICSLSEVDSIYVPASIERHKKYMEADAFTYKEYRKNNDIKLMIFILTDKDNINRLRNIGCNHLMYGISYINLEQSEIANNSTVSLNNTIRPNIDINIMKEEIKIHKEMLGEFNNMKNEIKLLTGEIINEGDLHEQLIVRLPLNSKAKKFKEDLENSNLSEEEKKPHEQLLEEIKNYKYAIYNMREVAYQFGGINGNGDYGSFDHFLLDLCHEMNREGIEYIIRASVYTLFSHSSLKLNTALKGQRDLSKSDKEVLDAYIERQVDYYADMDNDFNLERFDTCCKRTRKTFYETFFCRVYLRKKRLFIELNGKEKQLPNNLLLYVDTDKVEIREKLLELIIRYELYLEYGIHIPAVIRGDWYTEESYINSHLNLNNESSKNYL